MATNNTNKLFIAIPNDNSVNDFLTKYGPGATNRSTDYDNKIVFLGSSGQIFTQGKLYGVDNITNYNALKDQVTKLDGEATVDGSIKNQIAALRKEILTKDATESINEAYDTLLEISKFLEENDALTDSGTIVTAINQNTTNITKNTNKIGKPAVAAASITAAEWSSLPADEKDKYIKNAQTGAYEKDAEAATGLYKIIEEAQSDNNSAIDALDAEVTSTDGTNVQVKVTEVDGKITAVNIATEQYAQITRTETTSTAVSPQTTAKLEVTSGDTGKLVKASDVYNAYAAAVDKVTEEKHRVDNIIGTANTAADGDESNATGLRKEIEDAKKAAIAATQDHSETTVVNDTTKKSDYVAIAAATAETGDTDNDHRYKLEVTEAVYTAAGTDKATQGALTDGVVTSSTLNSVLNDFWGTYSAS